MLRWSCQFRAVGVNFSPGQNYLEKIKAATNDIDVQIVFNNAGSVLKSKLRLRYVSMSF